MVIFEKVYIPVVKNFMVALMCGSWWFLWHHFLPHPKFQHSSHTYANMSSLKQVIVLKFSITMICYIIFTLLIWFLTTPIDSNHGNEMYSC